MLVRSGFWNKQKRCWVWLNYQECWLECIVPALVNLSWCMQYLEVYRSSGGRIKGPRLRPHHMKRASGSWCCSCSDKHATFAWASMCLLGRCLLALASACLGKLLDRFTFSYRLAFSPCSSEYLYPVLLRKILIWDVISLLGWFGSCIFSLLK